MLHFETSARLWNTIYRRKARPSEICRQRFLHGSGTEDRQEQTLAENALWCFCDRVYPLTFQPIFATYM